MRPFPTPSQAGMIPPGSDLPHHGPQREQHHHVLLALPSKHTHVHVALRSLKSPPPVCCMNCPCHSLPIHKMKGWQSVLHNSTGSWGSWNDSVKKNGYRAVQERDNAGAEEKSVFSTLACFLHSGFRAAERIGRLFWYKSNYQVRHKNKLTDICQSKEAIIAMWGCFFRCLFLEIWGHILTH